MLFHEKVWEDPLVRVVPPAGVRPVMMPVVAVSVSSVSVVEVQPGSVG